MTGQDLLVFNDVSCRRGGRTLFDHLTFAVRAGDAVLLTGPNGIGKSSLIRLGAGLLAPAAGTVEAIGPVGLLTHDLALDDAQNLEAALGFWARLDGGSVAGVHGALKAMALERLAAVPVRFLSAGQRRRAAIARVIAERAPLWLLDEPGVGLDTASLALLADAIERHRAEGGAVVAATHMDLGLKDCRTFDLRDVR